MKNMKLLSGALFAALASIAASAGASIASEETLTFSSMATLQQIGGKANLAPVADGSCTGTGTVGCYYEGSFVVGIVSDSSNLFSHLHKPLNIGQLQYHSDASGIYLRALDSTNFSLTKLDFHAPYDPNENPDAGANAGSNDYWEILGFNTALNDGSSPLNPNLDTGNGINYASRVAYQTVTNGFDGTLPLNGGFQNINAFWIHYAGYPQTPDDGKQFAMSLDNVVLNAPATVPIPAAVWLFGSALTGLLAFGRRKAGKPSS
ncbi:hypothetical protein MTYM_02099 [Methylococcales bacterium]|nr:hypothetical protein MTYM_02099 [Methylococcales bacterium]